MKVKSVYVSKITWVNLILTLLAVIDLVQKSPFIPANWLPYFILGAGILNLILRIWFTDSAVTFKTK